MATSPAPRQVTLAKPATPAAKKDKLTDDECEKALTAQYAFLSALTPASLIKKVAKAATDILGKGRDDVPNIVKETLEEAWNSSAADLVAQQAVAMT